MDDKKIIITEDTLNKDPKLDVRVQEKINNNVKKPDTRIYEMYQKYANISLERNHVLTLRK